MLEIISDPTGVGAVAGSSAADTARDAAARAAKRPSHLDALVDDVRAKRLKEETLAEKLRTHIEQCEVQSALENVTAAGGARPRQEVYLAPFNEKAPMLSELHHPARFRDAFVGPLRVAKGAICEVLAHYDGYSGYSRALSLRTASCAPTAAGRAGRRAPSACSA